MASANPASAQLYVGLMSGTSLDGVDAVLADLSAATPRIVAHVHHPFDAGLREQLLALTATGADEFERSGPAALRLAQAYAKAVVATLAAGRCRADEVRAIGAHGQTVRHRPESGYTIQLNAPAWLAEVVGIDVVADFRSRDLAAGGQGAPLVPAFHAAVFAAAAPCAVINLGGIGNITYLPGEPAGVIGFDCGPGNVLLDLHAARHLGEPFDRDGSFAQRGRTDDRLLARLLAEPYLRQSPPKSTGRELFSPAWLDARLLDSPTRPEDVQRTLTAFTARSIADAVARWCPAARDVILCGGGTRNATLVAELHAALAGRRVRLSDEFGIAAEQVEALAFAWLAQRCLQRQPGNLPNVTGARGPRVLGAIYPR
ncbi:MAG: anhydro-N-acetylmuramic acid kinase [Burkholderiaceae bacterium]|nr:anhydro-N-acetylmuramic acid kinase [Burkholderiaceae bacterium]